MAEAEIYENQDGLKNGRRAFRYTDLLGLCGLLLGIIAWILLPFSKTGCVACAVVGIILSCFGLRGRFRNFAIGGTIVSAVLLLDLAIMGATLFYIIKSI